MPRIAIHTDQAPAAIGPYSQAGRAGGTVYLSGQIPLDPATGELVAGDIQAQTRRAFDNLRAVCEAAGGSLDQVARLGLYVIDLADFAAVNAVMAEYRKSPDRWVAVGWDREVSGDFAAALKIEVDNRPGALAQVAAAIAEVDSNIDRDANMAVLRFAIEVSDRRHLADVIRKVRRLGVVMGIQRI